MCRPALIVFFVSISALCGLWPHSIEAWLIFFDGFMQKLFPIASPGKDQRKGPKPFSLSVGERFPGERGCARRRVSERNRAQRGSWRGDKSKPLSPGCVFGYFLHKQKVTEVPGRAALGDGVTAHAAIKPKSKIQSPTQKRKIKKNPVA